MAVVAVQRLLGEGWDLLRHAEGTSRLQEAWAEHLERHLPDVIEAQDAAVWAGYHERDFGIRAGLLVGAMLAARADGSEISTTDVAMALLDAAAWLDADATAGDWPAGQAARDEKIDRVVVSKATELEMRQTCEDLEGRARLERILDERPEWSP